MSATARRVALVTGASRGIGKACAVDLAKAGFAVAVSARTVQPGERREHSSTISASNTTPLPGSLEETAALVRAEGAEVMLVPADLTDRASLEAAVATVVDAWGPIEVLVNNGRYIGPGHMDHFLDTPIDLIDKHLQANVIGPLVLSQSVLPGMLSLGGGTIVNMTSAAGYADPTAPAGDGGWGMGYGISKGAIQRIAGFISIELGDQGVRCFNLQPGTIITERIQADMGDFGFGGDFGEPPEVVGAVVRWLATSSDAAALSGQTIEAQFFCAEHDLLPGWAGPRPNTNAITYDLAGARLLALETELLRRGSETEG